MEEDDRITMLEPRFRSISLQALRPSARRQIAMHMDKELTTINVDNGMLCDWRGLAEIVGFSNLEISKMERSGKPTEELLYEWETNSNSDSTLGHLWSCLQQLDRKDVLSDSKSYVGKRRTSYIMCVFFLSSETWHEIEKSLYIYKHSMTDTSVETIMYYISECLTIYR